MTETLAPEAEKRVRESFSRQAFMTHIGAELSEIAPGRCVLRVLFDQRLTQQHGFFHAGVTTTLADTAAGYAAYSVMPEDSTVLTAEFKMNLLAPGRGEALTARANVIKSGRTLVVVRSDVFAVENGAETHAATMLATMMCLKGKSDAPPPAASQEKA